MIPHSLVAILFALGSLISLRAQEQAVDPFTGEPLKESGKADPYAFERKARAEDEALQIAAPASRFHSQTEGPFPNAQLPDGVVAAGGQVTVFADFVRADPGGNGVPLFLVNRTGETLRLPSQDNDLYFKLEFKDSSGRWRRAQNHRDSFCGNSYYPLTLPPGQHLVLRGYLPVGGKEATVRYRCYSTGDWTSNTGAGAYLPADESAAELDSLARRGGPMVLWRAVGLMPHIEDVSSPSTGDQLAAVALRSLYQDSKAFRHDAERLAMRWPSESRAEREALRALLDRPWPDDPQPGALLEHCLAVVTATRAPDEFPVPVAIPPHLAWRVLAELLRDPALPDPGQAAERSFSAIDSAVRANDKDTLNALAPFLENHALVDERLSTDRVKSLVVTGNTRLLSTVARILVRRGETGWLADVARTRPAEEQLVVLRALAKSADASPAAMAFSRLRNPEGKVEREFWQHCARTLPVETVQALYYTGTSGHPLVNYFDRTLYNVLREFLVVEAKRSESASDEDAHSLSQVVGFFGGWRDSDDAPLFRELLQHPAYQSSRVTSSEEPKEYEARRYRVREAARDALIGMGEPVPEGVVLEEKIVEPED